MSVGQWMEALEGEASVRFPAARPALREHIANGDLASFWQVWPKTLHSTFHAVARKAGQERREGGVMQGEPRIVERGVRHDWQPPQMRTEEGE
eukprot:7092667-Alexandrium_andersonii.AAC.1